jgi:3-deoxy-manno-octulosonate cytidylyltransferase (CMP-KDO synthetase)
MAMIHGRPMFWHVYDRARRCPELKKVVLATDDHRIYEAAKSYDIPVLMTRKDHISGTDRVFEAARRLDINQNAVVVNIQGDEPALEPSTLTRLVEPFCLPEVRVTTLARKMTSKEADSFDRVKVVFNRFKDALYFSRTPIPHPANMQQTAFYAHIGLYGYRMKTLAKFVRLGPSRLEATERLEQLRLLENGISIRVVITQYESIGVDRPEDLKTVMRLMDQSYRPG